ncbi:MAG: helix-turn-helix transcriptional regulator [Candidatus Omnitrophica bacterium]|nr:helix-turn-helix transcriptional regulator [Candidatus Omnitrophota bacterium]
MNKRHTFQAYLDEKLKNPKFRKDFEKGWRNLDLGYRLFLAREKAGMTQKELAKQIGTKQSNISRMEQGEYNFTVEMLDRIAQAFNSKLKIEFIPASSKKAA